MAERPEKPGKLTESTTIALTKEDKRRLSELALLDDRKPGELARVILTRGIRERWNALVAPAVPARQEAEPADRAPAPRGRGRR